MGRPREYFVDPDEVLAAIYQQTIVKSRELDTEIKRLQKKYDRDNFTTIQSLHRDRLFSDWAPYSAGSLVDGPVSDGMRRAITREVLSLEQAGLIRGDGKRLAYVQLTDAGIDRVQKKETTK